MYTLTLNKESAVTQIILEQNGNKIILTEAELDTISKTVDTELYYRQDVENYFTDDNTADYNHEAVLSDKELMGSMVERYAELRFENNGGDPDEMMDWEECLNTVIDEFEDELSAYLRSNTADITELTDAMYVELKDVISKSDNATIRDFVGYDITGCNPENRCEAIEEAASQMFDDDLVKFYRKYVKKED